MRACRCELVGKPGEAQRKTRGYRNAVARVRDALGVALLSGSQIRSTFCMRRLPRRSSIGVSAILERIEVAERRDVDGDDAWPVLVGLASSRLKSITSLPIAAPFSVLSSPTMSAGRALVTADRHESPRRGEDR